MTEDCKKCKQTRENCECHIPFEEKHKGLVALTKQMLEDKPACYKSCSNDLLDDFNESVDDKYDDAIHKAAAVGCTIYLAIMLILLFSGILASIVQD